MFTNDGISTTLRRDERAAPRDGAGGTTRTPVGGEAVGRRDAANLRRHLVVERNARGACVPAEAHRRVVGEAERQQHRLLDPLVRRSTRHRSAPRRGASGPPSSSPITCATAVAKRIRLLAPSPLRQRAACFHWRRRSSRCELSIRCAQKRAWLTRGSGVSPGRFARDVHPQLRQAARSPRLSDARRDAHRRRSPRAATRDGCRSPRRGGVLGRLGLPLREQLRRSAVAPLRGHLALAAGASRSALPAVGPLDRLEVGGRRSVRETVSFSGRATRSVMTGRSRQSALDACAIALRLTIVAAVDLAEQLPGRAASSRDPP